MDSDLSTSLQNLQKSIDKFTEIYSRVAQKQLLQQSKKGLPERSKSIGSQPVDVKPEEKVTVALRIVFLKIGEIDTLKENYTAEIFIYASWREPTLDGTESKPDNQTMDFTQLWNPKLTVANAYGDPKEELWHSVNFDESGRATIIEKRRLKGTFSENLELNHFPFDTQDLSITIASERAEKELELVEDPNKLSSVNVQAFVDAQEWDLHSHVETTKTHTIKEFSGTPYKTPAMLFMCRAGRQPGFFLWNILLVMFFICCLIFATFAVEEKLVQNRLQLSFTLVLTAVAFKFVVNQSLPKISYLTYLDKYILVSMALLISASFWHAIVSRFLYRQIEDKTIVATADLWALIVFGVSFVIFHLLFGVHIYKGAWKRRRLMYKKDQDYKELAKKKEINLKIRKSAVQSRQLAKAHENAAYTVQKETA